LKVDAYAHSKGERKKGRNTREDLTKKNTKERERRKQKTYQDQQKIKKKQQKTNDLGPVDWQLNESKKKPSGANGKTMETHTGTRRRPPATGVGGGSLP